MKLFFVRHGQSQSNVLKLFANRGPGQSLTDRGREQAKQLALTLVDEPIDLICTSPILRAEESARIISETLRVPLEVHDALREYDVGCLEGSSDRGDWDTYWDVSKSWLLDGRWDRKLAGGGESYNDIIARFVPFINHFRSSDSQLQGVIFVSHGGLYRCVLPYIFDNIDFRFAAQHHLSNIDVVEAERRGASLVCVRWGRIPLPAP